MKKLSLIITFFLSSIFIFPCGWDWDTIQMEKQQFPTVHELITGKFLRHSPEELAWHLPAILSAKEDELPLVLVGNVGGRGTTVFTACSHAGVVNVGLEARRLRPDQPIDLLLGRVAKAPLPDRQHLMAAARRVMAADGQVRPPYAVYSDWLIREPQDALRQKRAEADSLFHRVGITFAVYGESTERLIPFDIIPRIIPSAEWKVMQSGLRQRVKALNMFLKDIYGPREILRAGIVPPESAALPPP